MRTHLLRIVAALAAVVTANGAVAAVACKTASAAEVCITNDNRGISATAKHFDAAKVTRAVQLYLLACANSTCATGNISYVDKSTIVLKGDLPSILHEPSSRTIKVDVGGWYCGRLVDSVHVIATSCIKVS